MKFQIDHDYHIHSTLSSCCHDAEETPERILRHAKENGLKQICLTDHYWDSAVPGASKWYQPQNFDHIAKAKPLPAVEGVEFLFGCETDMDMHMTVGLPPERYDDFSFIIIPTTHMHMKFVVPEEDRGSNERLAALWVKRFDALLRKDLPFHKIGIAHPVCKLIQKKSHEDFLEVLSMIDSGTMRELFTRAAQVGCGIELNSSDMSFSDEDADAVLRPFRIAKECGCKFYLGSDAHSPAHLELSRAIFERALGILDLTEDDKFRVKA